MRASLEQNTTKEIGILKGGSEDKLRVALLR